MMSAFLLMSLMVNATIIGGNSSSTTGTVDPGSVAGCEDKKQEMKKLNCIAKDGGPAYGCSSLGTLEACTTEQKCP